MANLVIVHIESHSALASVDLLVVTHKSYGLRVNPMSLSTSVYRRYQSKADFMQPYRAFSNCMYKTFCFPSTITCCLKSLFALHIISTIRPVNCIVTMQVGTRHISGCYISVFKCIDHEGDENGLGRYGWRCVLLPRVQVPLTPSVGYRSSLNLSAPLLFDEIDGSEG